MASTSEQLFRFADLIAARLPGSVESSAGQVLTNQTERAAKREFVDLQRRFPTGEVLDFADSAIPSIPEAATMATPEQTAEVQRIITPSINETEGWIEKLSPIIALAFLTGAVQVERSFARQVPPASTLQPLPASTPRLVGVPSIDPDNVILRLGQRRMETAAVGFNETSLRRLTRTISTAMAEGPTRGVEVVARRIREEFSDMSLFRSRGIATTEMSFSMGRGAFDRAVSMRSKLKQWITVGDDNVDKTGPPICIDNEIESSAGIPVLQAFDSGHMTTPGHPRCHCSMAFFGASRASIEAGITPQGRQSWIAGINENSLPHTGPETLLFQEACCHVEA